MILVAKLDPNVFQKYVGGQLEIQRGGAFLRRGEIEEIFVSRGQLFVTFRWMARCTHSPARCQYWVNDDQREFVFDLKTFQVRDIGPGEIGGSRIYMQAPFIGEFVVLYPPDWSKIDPADVAGLHLSAPSRTSV